jgi:hypothetical protein
MFIFASLFSFKLGKFMYNSFFCHKHEKIWNKDHNEMDEDEEENRRLSDLAERKMHKTF